MKLNIKTFNTFATCPTVVETVLTALDRLQLIRKYLCTFNRINKTYFYLTAVTGGGVKITINRMNVLCEVKARDGRICKPFEEGYVNLDLNVNFLLDSCVR